MDGVVTLLNDRYYRQVEDLWEEFARAFGLLDIAPTPIPHFSFQIAERYAVAALEPVLREISQETAPFPVVTTGLGIFTGVSPVLYVPVVRTPTLDRLHRRIWEAAYAYGTNVAAYYSSARWVPHITLADKNINHRNLPDLIRLLSARDFLWELTVDNLAVIHNTSDGAGVYARIDFG